MYVYPISSDEEDLRSEQLLLKDKWRTVFDKVERVNREQCILIIVFKYDPEGFGEIPWQDFILLLAR